MRLIDEIYLADPALGSRKMAEVLRRRGFEINRKRVQRLMRLLGISSVAPKPSTSRPHPEHIKYPYLLRNVEVVRANQVWATDITYIPMSRGFAYLIAVIDWYSRKVLSWRLSNTMENEFCVAALEEALARYGKPEIFNSDQGAQFTSLAFTDVLKRHDIKISMDGQGRCLDNVFIERLWRTVKYEEIYLHAYADLREARQRLGLFFTHYNDRRLHQALDYKTPSEIYSQSLSGGFACAA